MAKDRKTEQKGRTGPDLMKGWAPIINYVPFTALQNITGQPAISLPLA